MNAIEHIFLADLSSLPAERMEFLRRESVRTGLPIANIIGNLVGQATERLIENAKQKKQAA